MHIEDMLDILACPRCKGDLEYRRNKGFLRCTNEACSQTFPVQEGIPVMITEMSPDLQLTRKKWDEEYSQSPSEITLDTKKDLYLESSYMHITKHRHYCEKGWFLELGCGTARHACLLAKEGFSVAGVDISLPALERARRLFDAEGTDGVLVCADILNLPFKNDVFGLVYGGGVIEHFEETERAIREVARSLVPGGLTTNTFPIANLASMTYRQLTGNIIDVPVLRQITEFVHMKLLRGRFMMYGYEKSLRMSVVKRMHTDAGLKIVEEGLFDSYQEFKFVPTPYLKRLAQRVSHLKPFWPMGFVSAVKT